MHDNCCCLTAVHVLSDDRLMVVGGGWTVHARQTDTVEIVGVNSMRYAPVNNTPPPVLYIQGN